MTARDRWIDRHLRRMHFGQFLQRAAEWLAGYLFVFGGAVLLVKLLLPQFWPDVLWLAVASIPVTFVAWRVARLHAYTRAESVVLLDRRLDAGGLLMTLSEADDAEWERHLPQAETLWRESLPRVRPVRFSKFLGLPLLFAVCSCFVPLRTASTEPILYNTVARTATTQLEEMLEELDEADVLEEEEKEKLREEIEKLTEETKEVPLTHEKWEVVDHLREQMRLRVDTSALTISKAQSALSELKQASAKDGIELSDDRALMLEKDVLDALKKMAASGDFSGASEEMQDMLQRLTKQKNAGLPQDAQARQQMLDELQEFLDQEAQKLEELRQKCQGENCPHCGKPGGT